jgi:hypothetical protein
VASFAARSAICLISKFIKMAQMLVVQESVLAAEEGEVDHPSDMLDEMRERFMVRGSRTAYLMAPFAPL